MSGSWVVASGNDSDRIVYGILVATDPQGMLWVVPMGDVLQEIQEELGAVQVLPFLKSPTAYQKSSDDKADRLRVGRDQTVSPTTNPEGSREINSKVHQTVANSPNREDDRENDSLRESTRMHNELSDMREDIKKNEEISLDTKSKCHYCGSLIHKEWSCPLKDDRKLRRLGRTEVTWTCEICHMGPQSDWNPTCPGCGHFRCNACEEYSQFVYDDS